MLVMEQIGANTYTIQPWLKNRFYKIYTALCNQSAGGLGMRRVLLRQISVLNLRGRYGRKAKVGS